MWGGGECRSPICSLLFFQSPFDLWKLVGRDLLTLVVVELWTSCVPSVSPHETSVAANVNVTAHQATFYGLKAFGRTR